MIGTVSFTIEGEPFEATMDDTGTWDSSLDEIAEVFNAVFPADSEIYRGDKSPTDDRFGVAAVVDAAQEFNGVFRIFHR
tara:strand:- start:86 stop:322 length:237 start_codon:yes stop_codon:yes gene_type:complete